MTCAPSGGYRHAILRCRYSRAALGLISYSEGTRYTPEKHCQTAQWCKSQEKPILRHTLWPRPKGFVATVQALRRTSHVKAVYDITVAYGYRPQARSSRLPAEAPVFMQAPTFWETVARGDINRKGYMFYVHVDRYSLCELPEDGKALASWLEQRWVEKDERLETLRDQLARTGKWQDNGQTIY